MNSGHFTAKARDFASCGEHPGAASASPVLGFQLLIPALVEKVLESVPPLGQNLRLLHLGPLLSQCCLGLAPSLKFPQRFLGTENTEYAALVHCARAYLHTRTPAHTHRSTRALFSGRP